MATRHDVISEQPYRNARMIRHGNAHRPEPLAFSAPYPALPACAGFLPHAKIVFDLLSPADSSTGVAPGFFRWGLILPKRGIKFGFQSTINAKNFRKIIIHLPTGGSMLRRGAIAFASPPHGTTPVLLWDDYKHISNYLNFIQPFARQSK